MQPAGVCRVQTVTAGPRADPRVTAQADFVAAAAIVGDEILGRKLKNMSGLP